MMRPRVLETVLLGAAGVALLGGGASGLLTWRRLRGPVTAPVALAATASLHSTPSTRALAAADSALAAGLFGADEEEPAEPPPPPTQRARPTLVLKGTVGTARALVALISGIQGRDEAVVVRQGDTLAGVRIQLLTRDSVVVRAPDTAWVLRPRAGWLP